METLNQGGDPEVTNANPMFQIDSTMMQNMLAQGIATALATYEVARNGNTGNNGRAVGLSRWIEKTEAVFHISTCPEDCRVNLCHGLGIPEADNDQRVPSLTRDTSSRAGALEPCHERIRTSYLHLAIQ
uniref:Uncharacterized protein n=1 Tax=Lactuca sativa TaxID=4236 RepID=A0A9R1WCT3_LACSA|nr:hypothetical protein LSAT_V11C100029800 [Lactuca sativa]